MKVLTTALLLFAVFMTLTVEADAGSFNLSGSLDPGFTIGRVHHNRRHKSNVRNEEVSDNAAAADFPKPEQIHSFDVPAAFTESAAGADEGNDEKPTRHHGGSHRQSRRY